VELADGLRKGGGTSKRSLDEMMPLVYEEMHRLASIYMNAERGCHTLQPTALVNESYMRLAAQHSVDFGNRAQVIGVAAGIMRRILRTYAEQRGTEKRGGDVTLIRLGDSIDPAAGPELAFSDVDEVLNRLAKLDERQAKVVELRVFGGLTVDETAEFLEISVATVNRDWATGKIWLASELQGAR
jgi:RNA polymerase sigma-70 factor (ECF subfamily)